MGKQQHRRLRTLVVDDTAWHWTVRQRVLPAYEDCRMSLSFFTEGYRAGTGRRLTLMFAPGPLRIVSDTTYFEAGTVVRLPDREWLNLHEPGTARRLLDAAAPALDRRPAVRDVEVDGRPYFDRVVDGGAEAGAQASPASASR
ncbi:hypothetical protein [Streptomyces sp. PAL114]|uniref:hypothetical protein n=1 Tax=Streptomyces sp. PAL114 TaxID=2970893 RepID=UPI0028FD2F7A|nr:hypothetical protein [Streptomyces sp. PAL114]MDU0301013.1 hypothetical protein [Streptomyces sp. PAL114]